MREIIDIQLVMSDNKMKAFFSVFTQCFSQTICDIDLCYQNLQSLMDEKREDEDNDDADSRTDEFDQIGSSSSSENDDEPDIANLFSKKKKNQSKALKSIHDENKIKIKQLCMELYGVHNVLMKCSLHDNRYSSRKKKQNDLTLVEKVVHCMKFIQICKNALLYELQKAYYQMNEAEGNIQNNFDINNLKFKIETARINEIIIIIGRKLSIDDHMWDDIDRTNDDQISSLAQMRVKTIFEHIIKAQDLTKIFDRKPLSAMQVATAILKSVFDIDNNEINDSYLN